MNPLAIAQAYFNAWNARNAKAVLDTLSESGSYCDPTTGGKLCGYAFLKYMNDMFTAFPDTQFEIVSAGLVEKNIVAAHWIVRGTNNGHIFGLPPTGKRIELPGADFIRVMNGKIEAIDGYFDPGLIPRQLGLQVIVQPDQLGPFSFGTSVRAWAGNKNQPGAISMTVLQARSAEEVKTIDAISQQIALEMINMQGFMGVTGIIIGQRMITLAAWENDENPKQMMRGGLHGEAMKKLCGSDLAAGGFTSVWVPARLNRRWTRCTSCHNIADASLTNCECGAILPEPVAYA